MSERIALPDLERLDAEQQAVADAVAAGPRGGVRGPVRAWLHSPELAGHAQRLGEFLRWRTVLEPRICELVILATCRHYDSHFMWFNHVAHARRGGIAEAVIDAIKHRREPVFEKDDEAAAYRFATEILRHHHATDETLAAVRRHFGDRGAIEIGALIAHYHSGAIALSLCDLELPDGSRTCLP